ncbi:ras and ef-hand domain-containing protein [Anaeramoeba flamelloides]|uniref:Ras and ef-hand domain-containing protein n=1 Tax=Anaeramoeba flamelloides TaxID=1746091 RepID=A0AAV8AEH1_9EUKA|nr:ras and ef-hand domain-containing protein [Anaeramoeba flamelloides]KAJ6249395.1 ras and ef-hand domain-containing protein [Anaeramoeba flamelloides]
MDFDGCEHVFKIILIGDGGVGKSCLMLRFTEDSFPTTYMSTVGVDFKVTTIEVDGIRSKLQIWDTAGQERFKTITRNYYKGVHGAMLLFDVTDEKSFENTSEWLKEVSNYADLNLKKILIGNKIDLESKRAVTKEQGQQFAKELGVDYYETSALERIGIQEVFRDLTKLMIKQKEIDQTNNKKQIGKKKNKIILEQKKTSKKSKCC